MSPYPVELTVLCFWFPSWSLPLVCYLSDVFYSSQTVKSFYYVQVVYSCARVLTVVMEGAGSDVANLTDWKKNNNNNQQLHFPWFLCSKIFFGSWKKGAHHVSLSFSVFLRIDLLLLLGYYYCCCCCSVAVVIKIQKIFNRKNNNYDVK